jgi:D-sedoheptulose 7-phosphate isomerase
MMREDKINLIKKAAEESSRLRLKVAEILADDLEALSKELADIIRAGRKILICGNGGSAADSSHMAAEMIVRLTSKRNRDSLPAVALNADNAIMTAAANDFGFEQIFARQVQGLGNKGDVLFIISTSGNSANLVAAAKAARTRGLLTIGLLGGDGGKLAGMVERKLIVPHDVVQRIQEEQIFLIHLLVELLEGELFGKQ